MILLFWKGYGYWVVLLPILAFIPIVFFNEINSSIYIFLSTLFLGYILIAYFGFKLNRNPIQKYKNLKTGEVFEVEEKHEFFFIPMQYWALGILGLTGLIILCGMIIYIWGN